MDNLNIFDLLITGSGLYLIYAAAIMKWKGEIKKGVLIAKDVEPERIRDKEGFINYMFPKSLFVGALTAAMGILSMTGAYAEGPAWVSAAVIAGYLAALILFGALTMKAREKFID